MNLELVKGPLMNLESVKGLPMNLELVKGPPMNLELVKGPPMSLVSAKDPCLNGKISTAKGSPIALEWDARIKGRLILVQISTLRLW